MTHARSHAAPLIVPVESQVRELDAKLLLACVAVERGFPVILGSRNYLHLGVAGLPRGVYLAKSLRQKSARMFGILHDLGHEIAAWDEEGLVRDPDPDYHRRNLSPDTVSRADLLLAWGADHERVLRAYPASAGVPIRAVGNARVDLLRPELRPMWEDEVRRIRERFGPFLLVNTNFGRLNHFFPDLSEMRLDLARTDDEDFAAKRARHRFAVLEHFREMIPFVADEFPDHHLVVRPHPSENHETWRRVVGDRAHVTVVNEGSVVPWLLAARALVHNGCSTSVEAFLVGTPAISYRPVTCDSFEDVLPIELSREATDLESLAKALRAAVNGELAGPDPERRARLDRHLVGLDGPLGSERIVDALVEAGWAQGLPAPPPAGRRLAGRLRAWHRAASKRISMVRPGHRNHRDYWRHRFPGTSVAELEARIARFGELLGRFEGVRVRQRSKHVYELGA